MHQLCSPTRYIDRIPTSEVLCLTDKTKPAGNRNIRTTSEQRFITCILNSDLAFVVGKPDGLFPSLLEASGPFSLGTRSCLNRQHGLETTTVVCSDGCLLCRILLSAFSAECSDRNTSIELIPQMQAHTDQNE